MSIEGRIAIDVSFADTSATGSQNAKLISLIDTTSYSSGKVAIVTGTCGTAAVSINVATSTYRASDGSLVGFTTGVTRYAFASDSTAGHYLEPSVVESVVFSRSSKPGVSECVADTNSFSITAAGTSGTAAYTAVFYGT